MAADKPRPLLQNSLQVGARFYKTCKIYIIQQFLEFYWFQSASSCCRNPSEIIIDTYLEKEYPYLSVKSNFYRAVESAFQDKEKIVLDI